MEKKLSIVSVLCLLIMILGRTGVSIQDIMSFTLDSGILLIVIPIVLLILLIKFLNPSINGYLIEGVRRNILEPYKLDEHQVLHRLCAGEPVYAENSDNGIFVKLVSKDESGLIIYLYSNEVVRYDKRIFIETIQSVIKRQNLKVYDFKAYNKLLENGYGLYKEQR